MENIYKSDGLLVRDLKPPLNGWTTSKNLPTEGVFTKPGTTMSKQNDTHFGQRKRKRTLYSKWQQLELENVFAVVPYPDIGTREQLAKIIRLPESKVQVWFQNRRARKNKNGKLDRSLCRRGSSLLNLSKLELISQSHSQSFNPSDPLITRQHLPNKYSQLGTESYNMVSIQQSQYNPCLKFTSHIDQCLGIEEKIPYTNGHQSFQWENFTESILGSGYENSLYDTQLKELEKFMNCSQIPCLESFPQTMKESEKPTSLGYISDVIYNAAIITNLYEF